MPLPCTTCKTFEQDRSKVSATDLDTLLDDSELRTYKQNFGSATSCASRQSSIPAMPQSLECLGSWRSACFV